MELKPTWPHVRSDSRIIDGPTVHHPLSLTDLESFEAHMADAMDPTKNPPSEPDSPLGRENRIQDGFS